MCGCGHKSCFTPEGRKEFKTMKRAIIKFRCTVYEKRLLAVKAKQAGTTLSAFCRDALMEKQLKERMSDEHISIYKMMVQYHNNFKRIGNMYKKNNPKLSGEVVNLANEIRLHLKKITR